MHDLVYTTCSLNCACARRQTKTFLYTNVFYSFAVPVLTIFGGRGGTGER